MKNRVIAVCVILVITVLTAQAIPTIWTGAVTPAGAPASLVEGQFESGTEIRLIWEQQDVILAEDLVVNLSQPGDYDRYTFNSTPAIIAAGTMVSSYILHFDPLEYTLTTLMGSVTFDTQDSRCDGSEHGTECK